MHYSSAVVEPETNLVRTKGADQCGSGTTRTTILRLRSGSGFVTDEDEAARYEFISYCLLSYCPSILNQNKRSYPAP